MIFRIHSKLLELCVGRSVVVHLFSDGGFGFARELLGMWHESWRSGQTQEGCFFLSVPLTPSVCRLLIATNFQGSLGHFGVFHASFFLSVPCLCQSHSFVSCHVHCSTMEYEDYLVTSACR